MIKQLPTAFLLIFCAGDLAAMEFREALADDTYINQVKMSGEIGPNDDIEYINFILGRGEIPRIVIVSDSPGGSLSAAMNIGRLLRLGYTITRVAGDNCASSCVIIAIGSTDRGFYGSIQIHRPYFDESYGTLAPATAQAAYQQMLVEFKSYLGEMGTPTDLVERMLRQASDEIEELSAQEAGQLLGGQPPWLEEWLIARCGRMEKDETDDFGSVIAAYSKGESSPFSKSYSQLLIDRYGSIEACEHMTLRSERHRLYNLILESCGLPVVTKELEYRLQSTHGWAELARKDGELGIQQYFYQEEAPPIQEEIVNMRKNQSYECASIDLDWVASQMAE